MNSAVSAADDRRPTGLVILAHGFRPFFLLAGLLAAFWVPLWLLVRSGGIEAAMPHGPLAWHGHEMVFGFTVAVLAGFLLTAASNWTGRITAEGRLLGTLVGLWIAARILLLFGDGLGGMLAALVDVAFLPCLALVLLRPIIATGNRRNVLFPLGLLILAGVNAAFHAAGLGLADGDPRHILWIALDIVAMMMVVMGGRVIPAFTRNGLADPAVRRWEAAEWPAILGVAAVLVVDVLVGESLLLGIVALVAGLANIVRMVPWRGWRCARSPILWILHVGYLWIGVALVLRGAALTVGAFGDDAALHALTAGAVGTLTLGMMTRVALGHTGRPLAVSAAIPLAYGAVILAALVRTALPFLPLGAYENLLMLSAALWCVGFGLFVIVYWPILSRPRVDGLPG